MRYLVRISPNAQRQMDELAAYLAAYSLELAEGHFDRLDRVISVQLAESPNIWSFFPLTGPPYRAFLFRVSRRTKYWIVYSVDEAARTVTW